MKRHTASGPQPKWPRAACNRCGETIQFVRVKGTSHWLAYDLRPFTKHHCGDALDFALHFGDTHERSVLAARKKRH